MAEERDITTCVEKRDTRTFPAQVRIHNGKLVVTVPFGDWCETEAALRFDPGEDKAIASFMDILRAYDGGFRE